MKRFAFIPGANYPDNGVSFETFLIDFMLEMESLSPLKLLEPGEHIEHEEIWELFSNVSCPKREDENDINNILEQYIKTRGKLGG